MNKPSQKAQTSLRALAVLKPTRRNVNINAQDITNTASNITANNLDITANNLNIATQQNTTDLKAGGGDNYSNSQSTKHQGSNLKVTGDLNISADNINIQGSKVAAIMPI
ncbi:hypothetical protein BSPWISOXPB_4066 [uncultured Gammaproteobacteria bacterium]|nr:hypothetical protein BSPWISOXPB_4066 [uncultured Gammaproteobacteria bacterium]